MISPYSWQRRPKLPCDHNIFQSVQWRSETSLLFVRQLVLGNILLYEYATIQTRQNVHVKCTLTDRYIFFYVGLTHARPNYSGTFMWNFLNFQVELSRNNMYIPKCQDITLHVPVRTHVLDMISHIMRAKAYTSICLKDWRTFRFTLASRASGAMYLNVPAY